MIAAIILLLYLGPILLYLFIAWLYLPKNSTISDLADILRDKDDCFAPLFIMVMPVFNIVGLVTTIIVVIIKSISDYIDRYGNLRIK